MTLTGKRALVVGAGSGIGRAVHDAFVANGAVVAVLERDEAKADDLRRSSPDTTVVTGDATVQADNEAAVEAAVSALGGLDVLVNCVGIFDFYRGVRELDGVSLLSAWPVTCSVCTLRSDRSPSPAAASCSPRRRPASTQAAAACSTSPPSSPCAGSSSPSPTSSPPTYE